MRRQLAYPLLFLLLFLSTSAPAAGGTESFRRDLRDAARRLSLKDDPYWNILVHYKPGFFGRESLIDDRRFFLSPAGKADPGAELEATIDELFREESPPGPGADGEREPHPRCRFPARYEWLMERLSVDPSNIPAVACPDLDNALGQINPKSAALIFASGHMNAPASMFGHTLLRIDSSYESQLLSYAVNYAARIDPDDSGIAYAFKGIFGFYPGFYSILPYYDKVKEYRNMDQRDMWEYRLALAEGQVRRMVLHVLELQGIYSDYFFFKENCSYNLLFLLEVASPGPPMTDRFRYWTTPADTLRAVREAGLIADPVFRPSQARKIGHLASLVGDDGVRGARAVIDGTVSPDAIAGRDMPPRDKAAILDLASEYTQMRYGKKKLPKEEFQERYLGILAARSRVRDLGETFPPIPQPERPENGHATARVSLGAGVREEEVFIETSFRPAYHDLLDADDGYTEGSQIDFSNAALRYYPKAGRTRLQRWDLVHIVSLAGRDEFFKPVSWKFRTGFETKQVSPGTDALVFLLSPGGGFAWRTAHLGIPFLLAETEADLSEKYGKGYAARCGVTGGILRQAHPSWKVLLEARLMYGVLGGPRGDRDVSVALRQRVRLGRNDALSLDAERAVSPGIHRNEVRMVLYRYF